MWDENLSEDRKKKLKIISDQFNEEIIKLAIMTEKEIQQMVDDSTIAFESMFGRKSDPLNDLLVYDNLILNFIHNLLVARDVKKNELLKRAKT